MTHSDPKPAASEPLKGDEGAQQVVREHGGCGEFMPNNRICILPQGHEQPHGEPAASDDLFTADDLERMYQQPGSATTADWLRARADQLSAENAAERT